MDNKERFWIDKLLSRFCSAWLYEGIQGDLWELYYYEKEQSGAFVAKCRYHWRAIGFFRSTFGKKTDQLKTNIAMWQNFFTITFRNIRKHKAYSVINILGLAIGLAAGFLILQYVQYETTYDTFFENKENIYRVQLNRYNNGELTTQWAAGCAGAGYHMKADFPEVERFVNLHQSSAMISHNRNYFQPESAYYAGEEFFRVFSIPVLHGNPNTALTEPYTVALSHSMSQKLFGDEDPIGQNIKMNDETDFTVTCVYQDFPEKSHMNFDVLYSFETYVAFTSEDARTRWQWDGFLNYVVLKKGTDPKKLEAKFPEWILQREGEELKNYNAGMEFLLQPLTDIHLTSHYRGEIKPTGDRTATLFLLIIGMFVLVIAWINYINLTTARSINRAKEVGIRKVMGSFKSQLVHQFLFESSILNLLALIGSVTLVLLAFPYFNDFIGRPTSYSWPSEPWFWIGLGGLFILGIILSGFYPAVVLANFRPVTVLKGKFSGSTRGNIMRKGLVVFQFMASIILITSTYIVYQQLSYLQNQDLGFNMEQTLVLPVPSYSSDSLLIIRQDHFQNSVTSESFVSGFTNSTSVPGRDPGWNAGGLRLTTQTDAEANQYRVIAADANYLDFFGLAITSGRKFDSSYGNESANVLVNESAASLLGFSDPSAVIQKDLFFWGDTFKIIGVVKNYRQESPKASYDPLVFRYRTHTDGRYSIKLNTNNMSAALEAISGHWQEAFGDKPMDYFFLDDYYNEQYQAELKFGSIFGIFSGLSILVACLGLFGLASFMTSLRTKEVGVRKVLGASFSRLLVLLTSDFLKLVGIAIVISIPVSWWIMDQWLQNFASRMTLSPLSFLLPAIVLAIIALATVSYHTYFTANLNPARTLKDE